MLHKLSYDGIKLPVIYVAKTNEDILKAKDLGAPYIVWADSDKALVRAILVPYVRKMFPYVKIEAGRTQSVINVPAQEVAEPEERDGEAATQESVLPADYSEIPEGDVIEDQETEINSFGYTEYGAPVREYERTSIENYMGDIQNSVDIEALAALNLLPVFVTDVARAIRHELEGQCVWSEGYNKKRRVPIGNFDRSEAAPNLVIIDVSYSIPQGISSTMLALAATLRERCYADLIVTGGKSYYWKYGDDLPSPAKLRALVPMSNESSMFHDIIENQVEDEYANVISFGDFDSPTQMWYKCRQVKVGKIISYHTGSYARQHLTGYAVWAKTMNQDAETELHNGEDWCTTMKR